MTTQLKERWPRVFISVMFGIMSFATLPIAATVYDQGRPLDALCWFALALCLLGYGVLSNAVLATR